MLCVVNTTDARYEIESTGMKINIEQRGETVAVGWAQGRSHAKYEDRFRMLTKHIPMVAATGLGELLAVCDGVGSAPLGVQAAQAVCDALIGAYKTPPKSPERTKSYTCATDGERASAHSHLLHALMMGLGETQANIRNWGPMEGSDRPQGAAAATVAFISPDACTAHILHAGDTIALLVGEDGNINQLSSLDQAPGGEMINYFGAPNMRLHHSQVQLKPGDRLLLASDGVTKVLSNRQLAERSSAAANPKSLCMAILGACASVTSDDITLLVYEVE